jgi:hypothetical protein
MNPRVPPDSPAMKGGGVDAEARIAQGFAHREERA